MQYYDDKARLNIDNYWLQWLQKSSSDYQKKTTGLSLLLLFTSHTNTHTRPFSLTSLAISAWFSGAVQLLITIEVMSAGGKDYHVAHCEFSMWGEGLGGNTHRGIITGLFAVYSYDCRRVVLLNPPALSVHECVWVFGDRWCLDVSGSVLMWYQQLYSMYTSH